MADSIKRKRIEGDSSLPRVKKAKVSGPAFSSIQVTSVLKPPIPPVIATSPGITLPESLEFHVYARAEKAKKKRTGSSGDHNEILLHSEDHERMDFTAREDRPVLMNKLLKHYIGAFDPQTGELQIVEARKLIVRGAVRSRKAADEAMSMPVDRKMYAAQKAELGETFGTKKAKKALKDMVDNAIERTGKISQTDAAVLGAVRKNTADMLTREEMEAMVGQLRPIPPGHFDAKIIQEVYDPEEIIGAQVLKAIPIMDWQETLKKGEAVQVPSRFVAHRIHAMAAHQDATMKLRLLRYLLWVLVFWQCTAQGRRNSDKRLVGRRETMRQNMAPAPDVVIESIRRKFSEGQEMRKFHMDLLKTHCCVLSCLLDNFESDTLDLREDLGLDQLELNRYFHEIGAGMKVCTKDGARQYMAQLALPLRFPKPPRPRKV